MNNADIVNLTKQTEEMNAAIAKLRAEYREKIKVSFHEATKSFFEQTPSVKMLEWTQYSPHWNDGEECTFSVHDVWYYLQSQDPEDYSYGEEAGFGDIQNIPELERLIALYESIDNGSLVPTQAQLSGWDYYYVRDGGRDHYDYRTRSYISEPAFINTAKLKSQLAAKRQELIDAREEAKLYENIDNDLKNIKAIQTFIGKIDDSAMEDMFGNHVRVRVTAEGIEVDDYDHD